MKIDSEINQKIIISNKQEINRLKRKEKASLLLIEKLERNKQLQVHSNNNKYK